MVVVTSKTTVKAVVYTVVTYMVVQKYYPLYTSSFISLASENISSVNLHLGFEEVLLFLQVLT